MELFTNNNDGLGGFLVVREGRALRITREFGDVVSLNEMPVQQPPSLFPIEICGLAGVAQGPCGSLYLVVVSEAEMLVGSGKDRVLGEIYKVKNFDVIEFPTHNSSPPTTANEEFGIEDYRTMLVKALQRFGNDFVYYSSSYDLTNLVSHQVNNNNEGKTSVNETFLFNRNFLQHPTWSGELKTGWFLTMIQGFVSVQKQVTLYPQYNAAVDFILISRRSNKNAGMRYFNRGIDNQGNVANFVESEHVVVFQDGACSSFLQTRGSIPLSWTQWPCLKYTPSVSILDKDPHSFALHFERDFRQKERVVIVNLIDSEGKSSNSKDQAGLGREFEALCKRSNNAKIDFVWFDFHLECDKKNGKLKNLKLLESLTQAQIREMGWASSTGEGKKQRSVFRVNCMDNLDRTNVVQTMYSKIFATAQVYDYYAEQNDSKDHTADFPHLEKTIRNVWLENANALSYLYTGTGALKTDLTRFGKRTMLGNLMDGYRSAYRYYLNNFEDGELQNCLHVLFNVEKRDQINRFLVHSSVLRRMEGEKRKQLKIAILLSAICFHYFLDSKFKLAVVVVLVSFVAQVVKSGLNTDLAGRIIQQPFSFL